MIQITDQSAAVKWREHQSHLDRIEYRLVYADIVVFKHFTQSF